MLRLTLLFFLTTTFLSVGQTDIAIKRPIDSWIGHYEGVLYLEFPDKTKDSLVLHLDIEPTKDPLKWTHKFFFFSSKYGNTIKDYLLYLEEGHSDGRHYVLDEKNGIEIDQIFMNHTLYGHYEVLKNYYTTVLRKSGETLYYEIICTRSKNGRFTKSEPDEDGNIYEVTSFSAFTVQYAYLSKKN